MSGRFVARGFTMAELMVTLVIVALLAVAATPSMASLIRQQALKTAASDLFVAVQLTRTQAIARGRRVKLMPADEDGQDWSAGWIVFVDSDDSGWPDGEDEVIAEHGPLPDGISVDFAFSSKEPPYHISYNGAGRSCGAGSSSAAHFGTVSLEQDGMARRIKVNMLGRARMCDPARDKASCSGGADAH